MNARGRLLLGLALLASVLGLAWLTVRSGSSDGERFDPSTPSVGAAATSDDHELAAVVEPAVSANSAVSPESPVARAADVSRRSALAPVTSEAAPPATPVLRGRVVDDLGNPLDVFWIRAEPAGEVGSRRLFVSSPFKGAQGAFEIAALPGGEWSVLAMGRTQSRSAARTVVTPRDEPLADFVVPRLATISGRIVDVDGTPANGAQVECHRLGASVRRKKSARDGTFRLETTPGSLRLFAKHDGRAPGDAIELVVAPGQAIEDVELVLRRGGTIEGRVLDGEGRPVVHASVQVRAAGNQVSGTTNVDGTFRVERLARGTAHLSVGVDPWGSNLDQFFAEEDLRATVLVEEGRTVRVELGGRPQGAHLVRGTVRAAGPVAGALVSFRRMSEDANDGDRGRRARTNAAGEYELRLAAPGAYTVDVDASERGRVVRRAEIAAAPTQVVDLELGTARIAGRVVDPDGRPVSGAEVVLIGAGGGMDGARSTGSHTTGRDGGFEFGAVLPGTYELRATPRRRDASRARLCEGTVHGISITAGEQRDGVEIPLRSGGAVLARVVGVEGKPVARVQVTCWSDRASTVAGTDASGVARFEGLEPQPTRLEAHTESLVGREVVSVVPRVEQETEVELVLVAGGHVDVELLRADGSIDPDPLRYEIGLTDARGQNVEGLDSTVRPGSIARIGPVLPGSYTVDLWVGPQKLEQRVEVAAGEVSKVVLRAKR